MQFGYLGGKLTLSMSSAMMFKHHGSAMMFKHHDIMRKISSDEFSFCTLSLPLSLSLFLIPTHSHSQSLLSLSFPPVNEYIWIFYL